MLAKVNNCFFFYIILSSFIKISQKNFSHLIVQLRFPIPRNLFYSYWGSFVKKFLPKKIFSPGRTWISTVYARNYFKNPLKPPPRGLVFNPLFKPGPICGLKPQALYPLCGFDFLKVVSESNALTCNAFV